MPMRFLRRLFHPDEQARAIASLRGRDEIGLLTLTGNTAWDERINRTMILPASRHLPVVDPGNDRAAMLSALTGQPPVPGTLVLIEPNGDVHVWDLNDLLQRAGAGDEQAADDLLELELHVQQRALEAAQRIFPDPPS
jgi:hypothetical protein